MSSGPLLTLTNVTKSYVAAGGGEPVRVLSKLSLQVLRGETLAITGPSGSGKSTLLNLIGTLTSGERVRAITSTAIEYVDGVAVAVRERNQSGLPRSLSPVVLG